MLCRSKARDSVREPTEERMTVKVIGAGFGRTGTLSLKIALEKLGFTKCHHMMEVIKSGQQIEYWARIADQSDPPSWDEVFDGYQATADFPSSICPAGSNHCSMKTEQ